MGVPKPYKRTVRQFTDGKYAEGARWMYIRHPDFATAPTQYIRAFKIIQKDFLDLFDYIEPADVNGACYSYRTHALLMRVCIEVEANFKAIFYDNGCRSIKKLNVGHYERINATHRLSSYEVRIPHWHGTQGTRQPFAVWASPPGGSPTWYQAYNKSKHDRHNDFAHASFGNLVDAVCGLVVLLSAQFWTEEFHSTYSLGGDFDPTDPFEDAIGGYFRVRFPTDWPAAERYDFEWQALERQPDPLQNLTF